MKYSYLFLLAILFLGVSSTYAQQVKVQGQVLDEDTEEPQPFCNVYLLGTSIGTTTDIDGYYTLEIDLAEGDTLRVQALGYEPENRILNTDTLQLIDFRIKSSSLEIDEVILMAGENPANEIVRNIVRNKTRNDRDNLEAYQVETYSKLELDLDNITPEMRDRKIFKNFQFVFDNIDSTSDIKPFLPAYVSETISDIFYTKKSGEEKEVLRARKVSGVKNASVVDFISSMHEQYNIYDNWIEVLGKKFVSPFADQGLSYYEYYIMDSTHIKGVWSYKLKFKPKRKQENTFYGDFWVSMDNYAIEILNMRMAPHVNINLVERIIIYREFDRNLDSLWLPAKEKTIIDFYSTQNAPGIIGRKSVSYKNYKVFKEDFQEVYTSINPDDYDPDSLKKSDAYWAVSRHDTLSTLEKGVYDMVDSIQNVPIYKTYVDVINTVVTGFKRFGPIRVGPYFKLFSNNAVEGWRFRAGVGTSHQFSKRIMAYGYLAYGTRDKEFKYGGNIQYVFEQDPRTEVGFSFRDDVDLQSRNSEEFNSENPFSGIYRRSVPQKLLRMRESKLYFQKGWKKGWSNRITLLNRSMVPYGIETVDNVGFNFKYLPNPNELSRIDTSVMSSELIFRTRYAFKERKLSGPFKDRSIGSDFPIITLQYTLGLNGVLNSRYQYHKLDFSIDHFFYMGVAGWVQYRLNIGKVFGQLPFLLLESHPGNETFFYNAHVFNAMNRYEFVSDEYATLYLEHHWDGFLFGKLPLIRRLKLRAVTGFRAAWGSISDENRAANRLNLYDRSLSSFDSEREEGAFYGAFDRGPYAEVSVGIENIFRFIRVDALWRMTYLENRDVSPFNIRVTMQFRF